MGNIIAIVGRPNVGKSTLFNRLTDSQQAIVDEKSGVTRDRIYGKGDWNGIEFSVIDTGGYVVGSDDIFEQEIRKQVMLAIEEATVIFYVVDVTEGVSPLDEDVAQILRKSGKKIFVVANKVDNALRSNETATFYKLGLGEVYGISAINGSGTGDLLDEVVKHFEKTEEEVTLDLPKIAVIGRPNVGKSSLINSLLGKERYIVTPIAGTTRDANLTRYKSFGLDFFLVDTAGLRKKSKVNEDLEFYSVLRSIRAIESADVCLLLIDAQLGVESQDLNILSLVEKNRKGLVILINKWDLITKDNKTTKVYEENVRKKIAPFDDVPIIFISALNKQRIFKAIDVALQVYENRKRHISTAKLNEVLLPIIQDQPPPMYKGKSIKIKYITQLPTYAPSFAFFCNLPQYIQESYKRFLENQLRANFEFTGVPIQIFFRKK